MKCPRDSYKSAARKSYLAINSWLIVALPLPRYYGGHQTHFSLADRGHAHGAVLYVIERNNLAVSVLVLANLLSRHQRFTAKGRQGFNI